MDWDRIEDDWIEYKPLVKEKWSRLDAAVIDRIAGSRERLVDAIQTHYGVSHDQARREVSYWSRVAPQERAERRQTRHRADFQRHRQGRGSAAAGSWSRRTLERSRQGLWQAGQGFPETIRSHPAATLLIAVGAGLLIGRFVRRD